MHLNRLYEKLVLFLRQLQSRYGFLDKCHNNRFQEILKKRPIICCRDVEINPNIYLYLFTRFVGENCVETASKILLENKGNEEKIENSSNTR